MENSKSEHKDEFMKRFEQCSIFKDEQNAFNSVFGKAQWCLFSSSDKNTINNQLKNMAAKTKKSFPITAAYKNALYENIYKSRRTKKLSCFKCEDFYGVCMPLGRGDSIYGYLVLTGLKKNPDKKLLILLSSFTNSIIEEVNKELELSKLYDVIRPRAIALSTIHTIHRLISSTLDINELVPRISRLALQVLRAGHIEFYMKKDNNSKLECIITINYKQSQDQLKQTKKSSTLARKVAQSYRSELKADILAVPMIEGEDAIGVMVVSNKLDKKGFTIFDQEILNTLGEQAVVAIKNAKLYKEQQDITIGSIKSLTSLLDIKLPGVYTHSNLFIELILELGRELGLPRDQMRDLHYAALLPDLGKVFVPEEILKKPAPLDKSELRFVKKHTQKAVEIVRHLSGLKSSIPIILYHHERFDGKGYPYKLKGEKIPIGARIMSVGDAFEAMMKKRPHRKRFTLSNAVKEIKGQSGTQFDPKVVEVFMRIYADGRLDNLTRVHKHEHKKVS